MFARPNPNGGIRPGIHLRREAREAYGGQTGRPAALPTFAVAALSPGHRAAPHPPARAALLALSSSPPLAERPPRLRSPPRCGRAPEGPLQRRASARPPQVSGSGPPHHRPLPSPSPHAAGAEPGGGGPGRREARWKRRLGKKGAVPPGGDPAAARPQARTGEEKRGRKAAARPGPSGDAEVTRRDGRLPAAAPLRTPTTPPSRAGAARPSLARRPRRGSPAGAGREPRRVAARALRRTSSSAAAAAPRPARPHRRLAPPPRRALPGSFSPAQAWRRLASGCSHWPPPRARSGAFGAPLAAPRVCTHAARQSEGSLRGGAGRKGGARAASCPGSRGCVWRRAPRGPAGRPVLRGSARPGPPRLPAAAPATGSASKLGLPAAHAQRTLTGSADGSRRAGAAIRCGAARAGSRRGCSDHRRAARNGSRATVIEHKHGAGVGPALQAQQKNKQQKHAVKQGS